MSVQPRTSRKPTMRAIRAYAKQLAAHYPQAKIILFGSYAYGKPHENSDVDLLMVMDFEGRPFDQFRDLYRVLPPPFSCDLLIRRPAEVAWRMEEGDWLITDALERGVVVHEATNP